MLYLRLQVRALCPLSMSSFDDNAVIIAEFSQNMRVIYNQLMDFLGNTSPEAQAKQYRMKTFCENISILPDMDQKIKYYRQQIEYLQETKSQWFPKNIIGTMEMAKVEVEVAGVVVPLQESMHRLLMQTCMGNIMQ